MTTIDWVKRGPRRTIALVLAVVACMVCIVWGKVLWEGGLELRTGVYLLEEEDDPEMATVHLGRAIHWYAPFASHPPKAIALLWEMGQRAEDEGDHDQALAAYRAIRRGIYATRSLTTPHRSWLPRVNSRIAHLMAGQHELNRQGESATLEEREAEHLILLERDDAPNAVLSFVVVSSFFGWVGAIFLLIWRGFSREGKLIRRSALIWSAMATILFVVWLVALRFA